MPRRLNLFYSKEVGSAGTGVSQSARAAVEAAIPKAMAQSRSSKSRFIFSFLSWLTEREMY